MTTRTNQAMRCTALALGACAVMAATVAVPAVSGAGAPASAAAPTTADWIQK